MNQYLYPHINAAGLVHNLASGDAGAKMLLNTLSGRELRILHKNRDLLERIVEIAQINGIALWSELHDRFDIEVILCSSGTGDYWANTSVDRDKSLPKEFKEWYKATGHTGWYLGTQVEFNMWARDLLLQEVRTNLMIRYIEHKRSEKKKRKATEAEQAAGVVAAYGFYL
jgi:hypothetical protein